MWHRETVYFVMTLVIGKRCKGLKNLDLFAGRFICWGLVHHGGDADQGRCRHLRRYFDPPGKNFTQSTDNYITPRSNKKPLKRHVLLRQK